MGYASGVDDVAVAVADPVRREILAMLHAQRLPAGEVAARIAGRFAISRPAVSRHLRVLRECGLVRDTVTGRQRLYELNPAPLAALVDWLTGLTAPSVWNHRLDALETEVYRARRDRRNARPHTPEERTA